MGSIIDSEYFKYIKLHDAVISWPVDDLSELVNMSEDLNVKDKYGNTPLHYAAEAGRYDVLQLLLKKNASPNVKNDAGYIPLDFAKYGSTQSYWKPYFDVDYESVINRLAGFEISHDLKDIEDQLRKAIETNQIEEVRILLIQATNTEGYEKGDSNLLETAWYINQEIAKLLISEKILLNETFNRGIRPLDAAIAEENKEMVSFLLDSGAEVNYRNKYGSTPLIMAISNKRTDIIKLLLENCANPNMVDTEGRSPIYHAVFIEAIEIVELLLLYEADVNIKSQKGFTPMDIAKMKSPHISNDLNKLFSRHAEGIQ